MRVKSAYKAKPEPSPVEVNVAAADIPTSEAEAQAEAEGAAILRQQMGALRQATEHQRQQAAEPSLEARLDQWRQAGLPEGEISFLRQHPQMADAPELTQAAAHEALAAGHQMGSDQFHSFMRQRFDHHMGEVERRAPAAPPAAQTPEFFAATEPPTTPDPSALVSAPVSRQVPTSGRTYEMAPSQVRLTVEERQIARASGISETQYAANKLRMLRERAEGTRQR